MKTTLILLALSCWLRYMFLNTIFFSFNSLYWWKIWLWVSGNLWTLQKSKLLPCEWDVLRRLWSRQQWRKLWNEYDIEFKLLSFLLVTYIYDYFSLTSTICFLIDCYMSIVWERKCITFIVWTRSDICKLYILQ